MDTAELSQKQGLEEQKLGEKMLKSNIEKGLHRETSLGRELELAKGFFLDRATYLSVPEVWF
jgi:hypothetical protein